jgi:hypothetical protein
MGRPTRVESTKPHAQRRVAAGAARAGHALLVLPALLGACAQVTPPNLQTPPPLIEFLGEWGTSGSGPGQLDRPVALAADAAGNVLVLDAGSKSVHKFTPAGSPLLSFSSERFRAPRDLAVDSAGGVYVADAERSSVLVFSPLGDLIAQWRGGSRARLQSPSSLGMDAAGNVLVLDSGGQRVVHLDARGRARNFWKPAERATRLRSGSEGAAILLLSGARILACFAPDGAPQAACGAALAAAAPPNQEELLFDSRPGFLLTFEPASRSFVLYQRGNGAGAAGVKLGELPARYAAVLSLAVSPANEVFLLSSSGDGPRIIRARLRWVFASAR